MFIISLILFTIRHISKPDFSYDVNNYHIYLQDNPFINKINFDFFAGNIINEFSFPLGDRMNYIFRFLFGYRFGTILSYYVILVIFYQVKQILSLQFNNKSLVSVFSAASSISCSIVLQWLGKYYIDNYSIVFILEMIYLLLLYTKSSKKNNVNIIIFEGILSGLSIAIKFSNIVLVIPILIFEMILIKPRKNDFIFILLSSFLLIAPITVYLYDNYIQTGNIVFPHYNQLFKSKYFGLYNWKESRFGFSNILKVFIWPIYTSVIKLGYVDGVKILDPIWAIGYIFILLYIFVGYRRKTNVFFNNIILIAIILTFFWIVFLSGYMRYALVIPILYAICLSYFCINKIKDKKCLMLSKKNIEFLISSLIIIIFLFNLYCVLVGDKNNYKYIFKDHENSKIRIDGVWGVSKNKSAFATLVKEKNIPIYNLDKKQIESSALATEMYNERIKYNKIYIIIDKSDIKEIKDELIQNNCNLEKLIKKYTSKELPFINANREAYLYLVKCE